MLKIVNAPTGSFSARLDADLSLQVLFDEAQSKTTDGGEVLGGMSSADPAVIFAEGDI